MRISDWSSDVCSSDLKVLHERNVFLTVETLSTPYSAPGERLKMEEIAEDLHRVLIRFGFMETPDVPLALMRSCDAGGIHFDPMDTTYFASRETVVASRRRGMPVRSEEHTSEIQSLMRNSYAV